MPFPAALAFEYYQPWSNTAPTDKKMAIPEFDHDGFLFTAVVRPFEYNVLSRRMVRRRFAFDVLVAREDSAEFDEYLQFFQQVRGEPNRQKGILKVKP